MVIIDAHNQYIVKRRQFVTRDLANASGEIRRIAGKPERWAA
jgi:hypothetical protein